jgi:hypothetical protein
MKLRGLLAGIALILLTNAAILAGVAWNRRGEPDAVVTLTERELQLPWEAGDEEDTGLLLRLEWNPRDVAGPGLPEPLPAATRRELGFRRSPPPGRLQPARSAWVVLEMEGEAWRRWLAERRRLDEEQRRKAEESDCPSASALEQMGMRESRLVVVDAGLDREALRRRHPDRRRFVIVPGVVGPDGVVSELGLESIHVPLRLRPVLDEIVTGELVRRHRIAGAEDAPRPPRYRMDVAFGRRGEPWLVKVEKLPAPVSPPAGFASAPPPAPPGGCSG